MHSLLLGLVFCLGALKITEQKNNNPAVDIDKLLNYLASQQPSKKNIDERLTVPNSSGHLKKRYDSAENSPNLMNIQTLNLFFKHNNMRNKKPDENEVEQALRDESDRICKSTGRCGCHGTRCGEKNNANDVTTDVVDKILNDLEDELNKEQVKDDRPDDGDKSDNGTDNIDKDDRDSILKTTDNDSKNDLLKIVLIEASDLEDTRVLGKLKNLGDDIKIVDLRDTDLENVLRESQSLDETNKNIERTENIITPEDFAVYYEKGKNEITNELTDFVKGKKDSSYMAQLSQYQRYQINALKKMQAKSPMSDDVISQEVVKLVFGESSAIRILPQSKDSNIYVPQLVYKAIEKFKEHNNLRIKKNILPLTLQQKSRLLNKVERKIISNFSWRKNMQQRPKLGLPFNFNVQGLGQFNK